MLFCESEKIRNTDTHTHTHTHTQTHTAYFNLIFILKMFSVTFSYNLHLRTQRTLSILNG